MIWIYGWRDNGWGRLGIGVRGGVEDMLRYRVDGDGYGVFVREGR